MNELAGENSPYLLQHATNPVHWFPWGNAALEKAQKEDKLIIVSIGYAACHWCHVMEHESFADEEVAAVMNTGFVSIKVDREQRPDIDQVFMNAAMLSSGKGGWPLNAIALPDGRPVFAATYFPKAHWLQVLRHFMNLWTTNRGELEESAHHMQQGLKKYSLYEWDSDTPALETDIPALVNSIKEYSDRKHGGFDKAPKFPMPSAWLFMNDALSSVNDPEAAGILTITLLAMARGGIYDHIGGGFARYSTDRLWFVPHFEKMLYDNGQLLSLYARADRCRKTDTFRYVTEDIAACLLHDFLSPEGAFYSSYDADSEGVEGRFYTWKYTEILEVLGPEKGKIFAGYYSALPEGNWEDGENILCISRQSLETEEQSGLSGQELSALLSEGRKQLWEHRKNRIHPLLDDKILVSWNALAISGLAEAWRTTGKTTYLEAAKTGMAFILDRMTDDNGHLYRSFRLGKREIPGMLDDYSFTTEALLDLYLATGKESYLQRAILFVENVIPRFFDHEHHIFRYNPVDFPAPVHGVFEIGDNVIPSSNSSMAKALYILHQLVYKPEWLEISIQMLKSVQKNMEKQAPYYGNWGVLAHWISRGTYTAVFCGPEAHDWHKEFQQHFYPTVFSVSLSENAGFPAMMTGKYTSGKNQVFVCSATECYAPLDSAEALLSFLEKLVSQ